MEPVKTDLQEGFENKTTMNENSADFIHGYTSKETQSQQNFSSEKKSNALVWVILVILVLALVGLVSYYLGLIGLKESFLKPNQPQSSTSTLAPSSTQTPLAITTQTYSDKSGAYTFTYPSDVELKEIDESSLSLTKWGPTQKENTEFYDGISLNFKKGPLGGLSLQDFVAKKNGEFKGVFETSNPVLETVAGKNGYKFHVKGYVEGDYYYVELPKNQYLEIFDSTKDPANQGFSSVVEGILSSLKVL